MMKQEVNMIVYIVKDKNGEIFIYNYKPAKRDTI